jgi:hypothetical protein
VIQSTTTVAAAVAATITKLACSDVLLLVSVRMSNSVPTSGAASRGEVMIGVKSTVLPVPGCDGGQHF